MQDHFLVGVAEVHVIEGHVSLHPDIGGGLPVLAGALPGPHVGALLGLYQSTVGPFLDVYQFHVAFIGFGNLVQETEDPVSTGQAHDDRIELHADLSNGHVEAFIKGQETGQAAQSKAAHAAQSQDTT